MKERKLNKKLKMMQNAVKQYKYLIDNVKDIDNILLEITFTRVNYYIQYLLQDFLSFSGKCKIKKINNIVQVRKRKQSIDHSEIFFNILIKIFTHQSIYQEDIDHLSDYQILCLNALMRRKFKISTEYKNYL